MIFIPVIRMTLSVCFKSSAFILSALLVFACQPRPADDGQLNHATNESADSPLIINDDSVIMTPDYILSIKSSRYQPSLGLQGKIEPIKQAKFVTAQDIIVEEVLVEEGKWVEAGTALLKVRRQIAQDKQTDISIQPSSSASAMDKDKEQLTTESSKAKNLSSKETTGNKDEATENQPTATQALSAQSTTSVTSKGINSSENPYELITVNAEFSGRVEKLYAKIGQQLTARQPLLTLSDKTDLHFIAVLPMQAEPQLSVGQSVNFVAEGMTDKFTGQVSKLKASGQPAKLLVYVSVINEETSRHKLQAHTMVTGRVDYGQIEVGTIVPERALHDVDLKSLKSPPFQPLNSLKANVWIIGQDQRFTRQPVQVIEYNPSTGQYLIAGINNDSLIFLANLPKDSVGKKAVVS